jgi:hypothetical protein
MAVRVRRGRRIGHFLELVVSADLMPTASLWHNATPEATVPGDNDGKVSAP